MSGILAGVIASIFMSFNHTFNRLFFGEMEYNVWAFICIQAIAGGLCLVAISGWRGLAFSSLKSPYTWLIGFIKLLDNLCFGFALIYLSASEAGILINISKITTFVAVWLLFKRKIHQGQLPPLAMIVLPVIFLILEQPSGFLNPGVLWIIATSCCLTSELVLAEKHPVFNKALGVKDYLGFTGMTMAINGLLFLLLMMGLLLFAEGMSDYPMITHLADKLPTWREVFQIDLILLALISGLLLRATTYSFRYYSILKIKAEGYSILSSCQMLMILFIEYTFIAFGVLSKTVLSYEMLGAAVASSIAVVWYFFSKKKKDQVARA